MIDIIYLNESKRIRKEYLDNLLYIVIKEEEIQKYIIRIKEIQLILDENNQQNINEFVNELTELNTNINNINKYLIIYHDKIKQLDIDQRLLYNNIKEKYPYIEDEDMKNQIMKYIESVNSDFLKKNEKIYNKIINNK